MQSLPYPPICRISPTQKIKKNADGTYDFYNCDFNEAKDLSGDSLKEDFAWWREE